jgi:hypothetical protein
MLLGDSESRIGDKPKREGESAEDVVDAGKDDETDDGDGNEDDEIFLVGVVIAFVGDFMVNLLCD